MVVRYVLPQLLTRPMRRLLPLLALLFTAPLSAQQRGITAEDYFSFELVSDPRISPDGSQVVYVVSRVARAQNRHLPSVWIAPTDGSAAAKVLIGEDWSPSAPRWSPDGTLIEFVSARAPNDTGSTAARRVTAPRAQLWLQPVSGGAPRRVTSIMNGVSNCVPSPAGGKA